MFWQLASLAIQFILAMTVIWYVARTLSAAANLTGGSAAPDRPHPEKPGTAELLNAVSQVLAEHSNELGMFEQSLRDNEQSGPENADELEEHIRRVRDANQNVENSVAKTVDELVLACGDLLSSEQSQLEAYQDRTRNFDRTLDTVDRETLLAGIATKLLDMVRDLRDENRNVREEVNRARDHVTELMGRAYAAEQAARLDALTQLPNRRAFDEAFAELEGHFQRSGDLFSLVLFDVDHFKLVNDKHGHAAGDAVLSMIGRILQENRRVTDSVSRLGGEEFGILLPKCEEGSAKLVADRYRQKIQSAALRYNGTSLSVTVSGGVAEISPTDTKRSLLQRADVALYAAKQSGRNRVCVSSDAAPPAETASCAAESDC